MKAVRTMLRRITEKTHENVNKPAEMYGSALVWSVGIIAILMIVVLATTSVALAYASSAARKNASAQARYTSECALEAVVNRLCDGVEYEGSNQHPVLDSIGVGSKKTYTVDVNSPDDMSIMGECTVTVERRDDMSFIVTAVTDVADVGKSSASALIMKKVSYISGSAPALYVNDLMTLCNRSVLTVGDNSSVYLSGNFNFGPVKPVVPPILTAESTASIYARNIRNHIVGKKEIDIPEVIQNTQLYVDYTDPVIECTVPKQAASWATVTDSTPDNKIKDFNIFPTGVDREITLKRGKTYVFVMGEYCNSAELNLKLDPHGNANAKTAAYILAHEKSQSIMLRLENVDDGIDLYVYNPKGKTVFGSGEAANAYLPLNINGLVCTKQAEMPENKSVRLSGQLPDSYFTVKGITSSSKETHKWILAKYLDGE